MRSSFLGSDRTYGARRVCHDLLAEDPICGLNRIERLIRQQGLKARPRRRCLPPDLGERQAAAVAPNVLDRSFEASAPNRSWIADFTYLWTAECWLCVAAVVDLFSRRVVGWSMSADMTAQLVTDAPRIIRSLSERQRGKIAAIRLFTEFARQVVRSGGMTSTRGRHMGDRHWNADPRHRYSDGISRPRVPVQRRCLAVRRRCSDRTTMGEYHIHRYAEEASVSQRSVPACIALGQ